MTSRLLSLDSSHDIFQLHRDHPVRHPHLASGFQTADTVSRPGAAYEGYSGLEADDAEHEQTERSRRVTQTQRDEFRELYEGWAGL